MYTHVVLKNPPTVAAARHELRGFGAGLTALLLAWGLLFSGHAWADGNPRLRAANALATPGTAYSLTISLTGNGSGSVTAPAGTGSGINCGSLCREQYLDGSSVALTATPATGMLFDGWGGGCSGLSTPLNLTISGMAVSCTASFRVGGPTISTVAGDGQRGDSGDGGAATSGRFGLPSGLVSDTSGTLYLADYNNHRIRKISADGTLSTVAGTGTEGNSGDGGNATLATLRLPNGLALASDGSLYIADTGNHRIRKITPQGTLLAVAGTGSAGFGGDGGPATAAQFNRPIGLGFDASGALWVVDYNNQRIRKIDSSGNISSVAGTGTAGYSGDGGPASSAQLNDPAALAFDTAGNAYLADYSNHRIRKISSNGTISTLAGTGTPGNSGDGGAALSAQLNSPIALAVSSAGLVYVSDSLNHRVRQIDLSGHISALAGSGVVGFSGDGQAASVAQLSQPWGLAVDGSGRLYIADSGNYRIRRVETSGGGGTTPPPGSVSLSVSKTGDGSGQVTAPAGLGSGIACGSQCNDNYALGSAVTLSAQADADSTFGGWSGDCSGSTPSVTLTLSASKSCVASFSKRLTGPAIQTVAGTGTAGFSGDGGLATAAQLSGELYGLAYDSRGALFIADGGNHRVRKLAPDGTLRTVAGTGVAGYSGDGGLATAATLTPHNLAVDTANNLYLVDGNSHTLRKMDGNGVISTLAGTGVGGYGGDGGPALSAALNYPMAVLPDGLGNFYLADAKNHRVRKIDSAGLIHTVAGDGTAGFAGDGGPASAAQLNNPWSLARDSAGNLYIADAANARIRKVTPSGTISTLVGTGTAGSSGDGGLAVNAQIGWPEALWIDSLNNLYFADKQFHTVRRVNSQGVISTVAGTGTPGYSGDGSPAVLAQLQNPSALVGDLSDNLYLGDSGNAVVRQVLLNQRQLLSIKLAGTGQGSVSAPPGRVQGIQCGTACLESYTTDSQITLTATAASGSEFVGWSGDCGGTRNPIALTLNSAKTCTASFDLPPLQVAQGRVLTLAGTGISGYNGDAQPGSTAQLRFPVALALDHSGGLYLADSLNNRVRQISAVSLDTPANQLINTVAGSGEYGAAGDGSSALSAQFRNPLGLALALDGSWYVADSGNHRIRRVGLDGKISTVAGTGVFGSGGDNGLATAAQLNLPSDVAVDRQGVLYIADSNNHRIRRVDSSGRITTVAGNGSAGFSGDGGFGALASLNFPTGVTLTASGELYIADSGNHRIRKLDLNGVISTVAGSGSSGFGQGAYGGDGGLALAARLNSPQAVALDAAGELYIVDQGNQRLRKVDSLGVISTVAGTGVAGFAGDNGPPREAQFSQPSDVVIDAAGNLYVADYANHRVRKIDASSPRLRVSKTGSGDGTVTAPLGLDDGLECGNNCDEHYGYNSRVTLYAIADAHSRFVAWTGDCVADLADPAQASVLIQRDQNCTAEFVHDPTAGLAACPETGTVSVSCNGSGQNLHDLNLAPGVQIYNGSLSGVINNQGRLQDVQLGASAQINGGIVAGQITGTQGAPATLNGVQVASASQLSAVVIGSASQLPADVSLGIGVRFASPATIPVPGMTLTGLVPTLVGACPTVLGSPGLDLHAALYADGSSLLTAVNAIALLNDNHLVFTQAALNPTLRLDLPGFSLALRAVGLYHLPVLGATLTIDAQQGIRFITANQLLLETQPTLLGLCALNEELRALGLADAIQDNHGNLRLPLTSNTALLLRPDAIAYGLLAPANGSGIGVQASPHGQNLQILSYTSPAGEQQALYPAPLDALLLSQSVDNGSLSLENAGLLRFSLNGQAYRGVLDYVLTQGAASGASTVQFNAATGGNLTLLYPNGERQLLTVLP